MPVQARPVDTFTRDNLLLGLPIVEFTPLVNGVYGAPVPLGILSAASLQKVVEVLQLLRGDAGLLVVDRELVSRFEWSLQIETFNFKAALAQYIFASESLTAVTANAAQAVTDEQVVLPTTLPFNTFLNLTRADVSEASVAVEFATITSEAVGTGNAVLGGTQGDFALDQKIKAIGDVTSFLVNGVDETANLVAGSTPAAGQIAIETGEQDSLVTGSGAITFGASKIPGNGHAIVATYKPSFTTGAGDIVNLTDFVFDPLLGRIRFRRNAADATPFRLDASAGNTRLLVDYTYNRKAHNLMAPGTQTQFEGKATIKQLTDVGVNFLWDVPRVGLRVTDDELEFNAEDFAVGTLILNLLSDGSATPYGTMQLSSEAEANA